MIPKIFIIFIATWPDNKQSEDCGVTFITSGGFVPPFVVNTSSSLWHCDTAKTNSYHSLQIRLWLCALFQKLVGSSSPTSDPSATVTPESSPSVFPRYRGGTCMEFRLTTKCKSIDAEFVCDRLQNTVWLDDTSNNFGKHAWNNSRKWKQKKRDRLKLDSNNNNNNNIINNNTWQLRDAKSQFRSKKKKVYWALWKLFEFFHEFFH